MWNHGDPGSSPDVTRVDRALFMAASLTLVGVLAGCGSDDPEAAGTAAATTSTVTAPAPSSDPSSSAPAVPTPAGGQDQPDVSFDDQSGPGDVVRVARVVLPAAGFVVVTADDDDGDDDDRLVGSAALPAGVSTDVAVPLAPALTEDTDLEATLFADTDGNGAFDPAVDQRVREDDDGDDDDDVSEDADYDVI